MAFICHMVCGVSLSDFSEDAICLVLASDVYNESDYIRSFEEFLNWKKNQ